VIILVEMLTISVGCFIGAFFGGLAAIRYSNKQRQIQIEREIDNYMDNIQGEDK